MANNRPSWAGIKALARHNHPGLFEQSTSGMPRKQRAPIDRKRMAALREAAEQYPLLPKHERDRWRKA